MRQKGIHAGTAEPAGGGGGGGGGGFSPPNFKQKIKIEK